MTMKIATLRGIYVRSLFFIAWFALTAAVMHAIADLGAQSAYPHASQAAAR